MIPPQAPEIERAVLGSFLLERGCHDYINKLSPEMFYVPEYAEIFRVIKQLHGSGKQVDILTVSEKLPGKAVEITRLSARVAGTLHIGEHVGILIQKYIQREIISRCTQLAEKQYQNDDIEESLSELELINRDMNSLISSGFTLKTYGQLIQEAQARMLDKRNNRVRSVSIPFEKMQNIIGGWQNEDLIYIAARPGQGKTAISIVLAREAAKYGKKVFFFSLEMSDIAIAERSFLAEADIDPDSWKKATVTDQDLEKVDEVYTYSEDLGFYIIDKSSMKASEVLSLCRKEKPDIIFIDYVQLIKPERNLQNRNLELGEISHKLKEIAKEFKIPVVAMAQLNRDVEKRADKRPVLADLRDSGELEQDADIVIMLYRPSAYEVSNENMIELNICKHRSGKVGRIAVSHNQYMNAFKQIEEQPITPF
jgi:replicative DNA helicase